MPDAVSYPEAFNYATCCNLGEEFINTYGTAISWTNCKVDVGELMNWIEEMFNDN
jgi:hypothetical protein